MTTALAFSLRAVKRARLAMPSASSPTPAAPAWRCRHVAVSVAAAMFSVFAPIAPSDGQVIGAVGSVATGGPQNVATINSETVSCRQLKDTLQKDGALTIVSGQRNWGDTFYGPGVPQCEFWSRPVFSYVSTNDGSCGAGYVCAQRVTGGR